MVIKSINDPTDASAVGPQGKFIVIKSPTSYNEPGLPKPPAGWGKVSSLTDSVDGDDEGPESKDEY